jgi:hypothetical protein
LRKKFFSLVVVLFLLALTASPVFAQDYSFQLTSEVVTELINPDGTATIDYTFNFSNHSGAHPIDYVDVGMPNANYDIHSITADVDGVSISDIQLSPYVKPGVALGLGSKSIPAGSSATVHCHIGTVKKVLYPGTQKEKEPYASLQFSPTWFDSKYVSGSTDLTVTLVLPVTNGDEGRYYPPKGWPGSAEPQISFDSANHVFYRWQASAANGSTQYVFGAAFPARLVPAGAIGAKPGVDWITGLAGLWIALFAIFNVLFWGMVAACPTIITVVVFGGVIYLMLWARRHAKMDYLPPAIAVEGNGIKRGLTAVEAAILMEQPMDKILTMILFSLLKKDAARVVRRDPLQIEPVSPQPDGLYTYETEFLQAFQALAPDIQKTALQDMLVHLVRSVTETMKGFSRKESTAFYQDIIKRAWAQVESAGTPEVKSQVFGENIEWAMLDKDYAAHTHQIFDAGPALAPVWWSNYDPGFHSANPDSVAALSTLSPSAVMGNNPPSTLSLPTLPGSDFAASVVNGVQNFSAGIIGDVLSFTGGITAKTNPVTVSTSSGSSGSSFHHSSSSSHHSSCACACAGCACACAGGGR